MHTFILDMKKYTFTECCYFLRRWRRTFSISDSSGTSFKKSNEEAHIIKSEGKIEKENNSCCTQHGVLPLAARKCRMNIVLVLEEHLRSPPSVITFHSNVHLIQHVQGEHMHIKYNRNGGGGECDQLFLAYSSVVLIFKIRN